MFQGINGGIAADVTASNQYFQDIYFSDQATKNLCSMAKLEDDNYRIVIDQGIITCTNQDNVIIFTRIPEANLYALSSVSSIANLREHAYPAVVQNPELYTKTQISRALAYRNAHIRLGCPGRNHELRQLRSGSLLGADGYTVADVVLSDSILSPCEICIRSKAHRRVKRPKRIRQTVIGAWQHIDYFYLRGPDKSLIPFILFIDEASHRAVLEQPQTRETKFFAQSLSNCSADYVRLGKSKVVGLMSDNEGAVTKHSHEYEGQVEFTPADEKEPVVERYNGILKEIICVLLTGCKYIFPISFISCL
jgi:hypothetical protein